MKKRIVASLMAVFMLFAATGAFAAQSVDLNVDVTVIDPLTSITEIQSLSFGDIVAGTAIKTITLNVASVAAAAAANATATASATTSASAQYIVNAALAASIPTDVLQGEIDLEYAMNGAKFAVAMVGTPVLTNTAFGSTATIPVLAVNSNVALLNSGAATAGINTHKTMVVGATIEVPANADSGAYTGVVPLELTVI